MTKNELKPVIMAWLDGRVIQVRIHDSIIFSWDDYSGKDPDFFNPTLQWRIKPEKKLRPWKPEEVPVGAQFRSCGFTSRHLITGVTSAGNVCIANPGPAENAEYSPEALAGCACSHSVDGGLTWKPCGVE